MISRICKMSLCLLLLLVIAQLGILPHVQRVAVAADNGLAPKPLMGWSSFSLQVYDPPGNWTSAEEIKKQSDAMHEKLQKYGYEYINIDAGWNGESDEYGRPTPNQSLYPNGFQEVIDHVHANGQKIGIYLIPGLGVDVYEKNLPIYGTKCRAQDIVVQPLIKMDAWQKYTYKIDFTNPCAQSYINSIADQLAEWGINFVKFDSVTPGSGFNNTTLDAREDVKAWSEALSKHHIWLELSWALDHNYVDWWKKYANGWRIHWDVEAYDSNKGMVEWPTIARLFPEAAKWWRDAGPGGWNDFDSLNVGNGLMNGLTRDERQTAMTFWAVSAAQLYIGDDMTQLDPYGLDLLTNEEVIAINQAGRPAQPVSTDKQQQVWYANNGDGTYTVAVFNLGTKAANIDVHWSDIGLSGAVTVRDVWSKKNLGKFESGIDDIYVEPHASKLFKVTAKKGSSAVNNDDTSIGYQGAWVRNAGKEMAASTQDLKVKFVSGDHPPSVTESVYVNDKTTVNSSSNARYVDLNNDDPSIQYNGAWSVNGSRGFGDYMDDVAYTPNNGDSFTYTFYGSGISVITELHESHGVMDIYIDGEFKQTVDETSSTGRLAQQTVYSISGLAEGIHTIEGIKKSGENLVLDALRVEIPNLIDPVEDTFVRSDASQGDLEITLRKNPATFEGIYNGSQALQAGIDYVANGNTVVINKEYLNSLAGESVSLAFKFKGDYRNDIHYTETNGDYFQYVFKGTGVQLWGPKGPDLGEMEIYIDGQLKQTVNANDNLRQVQQSLYAISGLPKKEHTIKVVKKSGDWMMLDRIDYSISN